MTKIKNRITKILLIDDDKEYCKKLQKEAIKYDLELDFHHNLDSGIEALEEDAKIKAVILDSHCPIDEEQAPETAKSNFVSHALHRLTDVEHVYNRFVPYCVNSHTPKDFQEDLEGITLVFEKEKQHKDMFSFIKNEIQQLPETQIINKYGDVFDFFEEYMSREDEELLVDLLSEMLDENFALIVSKLNTLRRLEEKLFDVISVNYFGENPMNIKTEKMGRTKTLILKLKNQRRIPLYLFDFAMDIFSLSSRYGAHNSPQSRRFFQPTKYTVNSLIYAFLELCKWAENLIETE